MKIIELDDGLILYQIDPPEGEIEGLNLMALVEDGKALFLDTGYAANMTEALKDLAARGATPSGAVVSHYHPDHDGGLRLLGAVDVWACAGWRAVADAWREPGDPLPVEPTRVVSARTEIRFGRRLLELYPLPGHSDDSMAIVIDGAWLYAADSVLLTNDGRPLLPSVHSRPVSRHIEAIDWLSARADLVFIPGHGAVMTDGAARRNDLANRRRYLSAIASASERPGRSIAFEDAIAGCEPPFLGKEWHGHNYL
ncbi:MAG: MBL fold metallo-hydrolase [Spirochaetes bacterium]|nr:MBL fold metallo-hydrolase [Spirochaetota bacterium]MBU1082048.1 MBL fold metallo-hydrolase [Spirochaetota bacterium]